jgi:hypothetical protein
MISLINIKKRPQPAVKTPENAIRTPPRPGTSGNRYENIHLQKYAVIACNTTTIALSATATALNMPSDQTLYVSLDKLPMSIDGKIRPMSGQEMNTAGSMQLKLICW